jgi:hypothetical protein
MVYVRVHTRNHGMGPEVDSCWNFFPGSFMKTGQWVLTEFSLQCVPERKNSK